MQIAIDNKYDTDQKEDDVGHHITNRKSCRKTITKLHKPEQIK